MPKTADDLKALLPVLGMVDASLVTAAIAASAPYLGETEWGDFYGEALANWVADRIITDADNACDGLKAGSGEVDDYTGKRVGDVSVMRDARTVLARMANQYLTTRYGTRYLYLVGLQFGGTTLAAPC